MEVFWLVWTSLVIWTGHRDVLPSFLGRPNVNCKVKSCFCKFDRPEKDQNLKRFPYLPWTRYADFGLYFESEVSLAFSLTVFLSSGPPSFAKTTSECPKSMKRPNPSIKRPKMSMTNKNQNKTKRLRDGNKASSVLFWFSIPIRITEALPWITAA